MKIALISFSSTMRSNLAVGLPIDLVKMRADQGAAEPVYRIAANDPYSGELDERWSQALRAAQASIP